MKLLLITKDLADNSTGRAYVLWMLANSLGWEAKVVSATEGAVWGPVATDEFISDCLVLPARDARWRTLATEADLVVAVKALPGSFGVALDITRRFAKPLLLDIDDPDVEDVLAVGRPFRALAKMVLRPYKYWPTLFLRPHMSKQVRTVSNPELDRRYGGWLVPHARVDVGEGNPHASWSPRIAFVGTNRPHKGIDVLREAAAGVRGGPMSITITDVAPPDARDSELWVGTTSLEAGIELVKASDIVVIPSMPGSVYSKAQLPVKIIDAMLSGRAVIAADFPPLAWAIGEAGLTFRPGDVDDLGRMLERLKDPDQRALLGRKARARALEIFTVDAVASTFRVACEAAIAAGSPSE